MYPKVFLDYLQDRLDYGRVSVLPTPLFFYGMEPNEEVSVDIERGKTLIVRFLAVSDAHEDGTRTVFFELNGQPRSVKVPRSQSGGAETPAPQGRRGQRESCRRANAGHGRHRRGQRRGARSRAATYCVTIEAMKMETSVRADRDAYDRRSRHEAGRSGGRKGSAGRAGLHRGRIWPRQTG